MIYSRRLWYILGTARVCIHFHSIISHITGTAQVLNPISCAMWVIQPIPTQWFKREYVRYHRRFPHISGNTQFMQPISCDFTIWGFQFLLTYKYWRECVRYRRRLSLILGTDMCVYTILFHSSSRALQYNSINYL